MKFLRPTSLTARLACLFGLIAILTFASVGTYLYQSLARQLESRDDQELLGKIPLIRHLITTSTSMRDIHDNNHRFSDTISDHENLALTLKSANGDLLLQTGAHYGSIPNIPISPLAKIPDTNAITRVKSSANLSARAVAAWGFSPNDKQKIQIIVARTGSDRMAILSTYRHEVMIATLCGVLAALLGYILVRHGLRPINTIAQQVHTITAQQLTQRLDASMAPTELQEMVRDSNSMLDRLHHSFSQLSGFTEGLTRLIT
ncbi:MAG: two-component sensor histidine kinase, partial [Glaciimonas sp.]|nr:two-component sensor histidine kinase [Glaciimonas sp.]